MSRSILPLLAATLVLQVACAPKDKALTNRGDRVNATDLAGRDVELSSHVIQQLGTARQLMDVALGTELWTRLMGSPDDVHEAAGCTSVKKVSPAYYGRARETNGEKFLFGYKKCIEKPTGTATADASLDGDVGFTVTYGHSVPRDGNSPDSNTTPADFVGLPLSVVVLAPGLRYELTQKTHRADKITVYREISMTAIAEAGADTDTTVTYKGSMTVVDTTEYNVQLAYRRGRSSTRLEEFELVVDKAARKVVSLTMKAPAKFNFNDDRFVKSELNLNKADLKGRQEVSISFDLAAVTAVSITDNSCETPAGEFKMKKRLGKDSVVESSLVTTPTAIQLKDSQTTKAVRLCSERGQPVFVEAIEGVYL